MVLKQGHFCSTGDIYNVSRHFGYHSWGRKTGTGSWYWQLVGEVLSILWCRQGPAQMAAEWASEKKWNTSGPPEVVYAMNTQTTVLNTFHVFLISSMVISNIIFSNLKEKILIWGIRISSKFPLIFVIKHVNVAFSRVYAFIKLYNCIYCSFSITTTQQIVDAKQMLAGWMSKCTRSWNSN